MKSRQFKYTSSYTKKSLINIVISGVKGLVSDSGGSALQDAHVTVADRDIPSYTSKYGEYWRILLPGTYKLTVSFSKIVMNQSMRL